MVTRKSKKQEDTNLKGKKGGQAMPIHPLMGAAAGAIAGAALGAAAAAALSTPSVKQKVSDVVDQVTDKATDIMDDVSHNMQNKGQKVLSKGMDSMKSQLTEGKIRE